MANSSVARTEATYAALHWEQGERPDWWRQQHGVWEMRWGNNQGFVTPWADEAVDALVDVLPDEQAEVQRLLFLHLPLPAPRRLESWRGGVEPDPVQIPTLKVMATWRPLLSFLLQRVPVALQARSDAHEALRRANAELEKLRHLAVESVEGTLRQAEEKIGAAPESWAEDFRNRLDLPMLPLNLLKSWAEEEGAHRMNVAVGGALALLKAEEAEARRAEEARVARGRVVRSLVALLDLPGFTPATAREVQAHELHRIVRQFASPNAWKTEAEGERDAFLWKHYRELTGIDEEEETL